MSDMTAPVTPEMIAEAVKLVDQLKTNAHDFHIYAESTVENAYVRVTKSECETAAKTMAAAALALSARAAPGPAPKLQPVNSTTMLIEARGHLGAAIHQSLPSDDRIIMAHVRSAHDLLRILMEAQS